MSEFTAGPIEILSGGLNICIKFPNGITIVVGDAIYNRERSLEIANMLSAAPDMYEALKNLTRGQLQTPTFKGYVKHAVAVAEAAIAKAEGRE